MARKLPIHQLPVDSELNADSSLCTKVLEWRTTLRSNWRLFDGERIIAKLSLKFDDNFKGVYGTMKFELNRTTTNSKKFLQITVPEKFIQYSIVIQEKGGEPNNAANSKELGKLEYESFNCGHPTVILNDGRVYEISKKCQENFCEFFLFDMQRRLIAITRRGYNQEKIGGVYGTMCLVSNNEEDADIILLAIVSFVFSEKWDQYFFGRSYL